MLGAGGGCSLQAGLPGWGGGEGDLMLPRRWQLASFVLFCRSRGDYPCVCMCACVYVYVWVRVCALRGEGFAYGAERALRDGCVAGRGSRAGPGAAGPGPWRREGMKEGAVGAAEPRRGAARARGTVRGGPGIPPAAGRGCPVSARLGAARPAGMPGSPEVGGGAALPGAAGRGKRLLCSAINFPFWFFSL